MRRSCGRSPMASSTTEKAHVLHTAKADAPDLIDAMQASPAGGLTSS
jgi:hypothetical protein